MTILAPFVILFCCIASCVLTPFRVKYGRRNWPLAPVCLGTSIVGIPFGLVMWLAGWPAPISGIIMVIISAIILFASLISIAAGKKQNYYLKAIAAGRKREKKAKIPMQAEESDIAGDLVFQLQSPIEEHAVPPLELDKPVTDPSPEQWTTFEQKVQQLLADRPTELTLIYKLLENPRLALLGFGEDWIAGVMGMSRPESVQLLKNLRALNIVKLGFSGRNYVINTEI
ncbi:MAG: hypothetical protein Q6353_012775 [Candidatus Sigynarchaeum springense]